LGLRRRGDSCPGMHGDAAHPRSRDLALPGVKPRSYLEAERVDCVADGARAPDGSGGAVEDGEEAVARHVDLAPAEAFELPPGDADISLEHLPPASVAHRGRLLRRAHDVGEHDRDEHAIRIGARSRARDELFDLVDEQIQGLLIEGLEEMVVTGKLDIPGAADVLGRVASGLDGNGPVPDAMENQGRSLDRGQNVLYVDPVVGPHQRKDGARTGRGALQPGKPLYERRIVATARRIDGDEHALAPVDLDLAKESHCSWSTDHGSAFMQAKLPHSTRADVRSG
jgi:hypothetical protein